MENSDQTTDQGDDGAPMDLKTAQYVLSNLKDGDRDEAKRVVAEARRNGHRDPPLFEPMPYEETVRALATAGLYDKDPIDPWDAPGRPSVPWDLRTAPVEPGGDLKWVKANKRLTTWRDAILGRKPLPDSGLPGYARLVLLAASVWMDRDGSRAWPSVPTLARACGVANSTVRKHLRMAEEGGWICRVQLVRGDSDGDKGWSTNLLVPGIPAGTLPQDGAWTND